MTTKQYVLSQTDILNTIDRVCELHDDVPISSELAALYLGITHKTLSRLRQNGDGPPYLQYPASGSKARNQRVNYVMGDLRNYRNKNRVKSTMEAAVLRGMALTTTSSLSIEQPFYVEINRKGQGIIVNHVLALYGDDLSDYIDFPQYHVVWMNWNVALNSPTWKDSDSELSFREKYKKLLGNIFLSKISNRIPLAKSHQPDNQ